VKRVTNILKRWSTDQLITGIELQDWVKLLAENGWQVSPAYLHRAAWITGWSVPATALGRLEDARYGRQLATQEIDPEPLFLIGHWRSGTTHLHNLFGRAPGNTYSTVYQVVFPSSFLTTGSFVPKLTAGMLPSTRTYDNVRHGWDEAAEDEIALAKLTGLSPYIAFMFPDQAARYERYIDFLECTSDEKRRWMEAFRYFIKKIMIQTEGDRVVVKSCTHTARIRMILEMFPNAKFVHIHRHPYRVYASTLHMRSHTDWENFFQLPEENWEGQRAEQTLVLGQRIFERVVEDRHLIPEGNYYELAYDDLVGNEIEVVRDIYDKLDLPGWGLAEPVIRRYLEGLEGFRTNVLPDLDKRTRDKVYESWRVAFDEFGYTRDPQEDGVERRVVDQTDGE
jgi:hypothetical protein